MATVELTFSALPTHVRTARLITTAVARRSGVDEPVLDEVRLAVGEACSRAVEAHQRHCPDQPVRLELRDESDRFEVVVTDAAPGDDVVDVVPTMAYVPPQDGTLDSVNLGLAVIAGLADDVKISSTPTGVQITMSWPAVGTQLA